MPQATIKLQSAPAPASAQKISPVSAENKSSLPKPSDAEVSAEPEENAVVGDAVPLPLLLAAAALALVALGIQFWMFLS
jgi:hypothetical protein